MRAHHVIVFSVCVSGKGFHTLQLCWLKGCSSSRSACSYGPRCHPFTVWSFAITTAWKWSSTWKTSTELFLISHIYTVSASPLKVNQLWCSINLTIFSYIYQPWVELFSVCMFLQKSTQCYTVWEQAYGGRCIQQVQTYCLAVHQRAYCATNSYLWVYKQQQQYIEPNTAASWESDPVGEKTELGEFICVFINTCIKRLVLVI